ncbi:MULTISPECIES: DUF4232 domain-containing protein [unclassified Frankia]|uniref:DUF4232 domain-containing protein n=1 Tax=unclassified Frankia TaxID=2632575 RepID=UPI002AD50E4D|nr:MULTISPECIES: DUF4232 domain-containing protein [unclassified Frankia]
MSRPARECVARIAVAVALMAVSTGCASSAGGVAATPASGRSPSPSSAARTVFPPGATSGSAVGSTAADPGHGCLTVNLRVSAANLDNAAGHSYEQIILTNIGATSCVIGGFPGVSYVDAGGRQLGAAADRTGGPGMPVPLLPGQHVTGVLAMIHTGIQAGCEEPYQTAEAVGLRVYPPANLTALLLPGSGPETVCASPSVHQLQISALTR